MRVNRTTQKGRASRLIRSCLRLTILYAATFFYLTLMACKNSHQGQSTSSAPPIPTVAVATVAQKDVPIYEEAVGSVVGFVNADILPKVSGYLLKQDYQDGAPVHHG